MRVLKAAADEIDHEIGTVDINGGVPPYSNPPAISPGQHRACGGTLEAGAVTVRDRGIGDEESVYTAGFLGSARSQARDSER